MIHFNLCSLILVEHKLCVLLSFLVEVVDGELPHVILDIDVGVIKASVTLTWIANLIFMFLHSCFFNLGVTPNKIEDSLNAFDIVKIENFWWLKI